MSLLSGNGHLGAVDNTPNTTRHITFMLMANLLANSLFAYPAVALRALFLVSTNSR